MEKLNFDYLRNRKIESQKTYLHSIVEEVCRYLYGENWKNSDCWKLWLGIGKRIGAGQLKSKLNYAKSRGIKNPRYLLATCRLIS